MLATSSSRTIATACRRRLFLRTFATGHDVVECDVVIVGGGPVGLALASALGSSKVVRESQRVTLVEAGDLSKIHDWSPSPNTFSNRVSSLTNISHTFLKEIGAWDHVDASRTCPIEEMQVWDGMSDARITFTASELPITASHLSRMTENLNLQRGLLRRLSQIPEIRLLDNVRVDLIQKEERQDGNGWPIVRLSNGQTLRSRLLVGADGFNSPVRSYTGIGSYGWAYNTHAIVATLNHPNRQPPRSSNTVAYQRFLPTGPAAFLPLSPTESSLVWSTKPCLAAALKAIEPAVLVSLINTAFRIPEVSLRYLHERILECERSGSPISLSQIQEEISWRERSHGINNRSAYSSSNISAADSGVPPEDAYLVPPGVTSIQPGSIASFPLRFSHTDSYIGDEPHGRTVLVGDAAHTIHPLAGQGLNIGLGDVESLARCIETVVIQGGDIGSRTALSPYARDRYLENHTILAAADKLHKLYSSSFGPVVWARSVGLEIVNELDVVKAALMGIAGSALPQRSRSGQGWDLAAACVEGVSGAADGAKKLGRGLFGVVGMGLQELGNAIARKQR